MTNKHFSIIFSSLAFLIIMTSGVNAGTNLYLCQPSPDYFSSLSIGETFTMEVVAEADAPGVTLFAFIVTWSPESSVEFVHPKDGGSLDMTGFFPSSGSNRLSGIAPDSTSQYSTGSTGATSEITVFTAPAMNSTGPDSLARITFRKLSASQPQFSLGGAQAAQYLGGTSSTWVSVSSQGYYDGIDAGSATMSGAMLSQATAAVVNIGGNDYQAEVTGNTWTLYMKSASPSLNPQQVTVKSMSGGNLLSSISVTEIIRSPGWFASPDNHSEHPADVDGDGVRGLTDLMILGQSYGASAGDTRYDFRTDYNADGAINLVDLLIFTYYGK